MATAAAVLGTRRFTTVGDVPRQRRMPRRTLSQRMFAPTNISMPSKIQMAMGMVVARVKERRDGRPVGSSTFLILDPNSKRLQLWDAFCLLVTMITAFTTPFEMAFVPHLKAPLHSNGVFLANRLIDAVFFADFFLRLLCVPYRSGRRANHYVKDRKMIARHYLRTWLGPDLLALVPFDIMTYEKSAVLTGQRRIVALLRLCRLVRMLKLGRVMTLVERWSEASSIPYSYIDIAKLLSYIIITVHWVACAWGLVGELQRGKSYYWLEALRGGIGSSCAFQRHHDEQFAYLEARHGSDSREDRMVRSCVESHHWFWDPKNSSKISTAVKSNSCPTILGPFVLAPQGFEDWREIL